MVLSSSEITPGSLSSSTSQSTNFLKVFFPFCLTAPTHSMLYTRVPKYEELKSTEQELYHYDKDIYNKSARKGGKSLYFAKSGTAGETWVPLIEKAYAKLHGNYSHLIGGHECDAIEDLTG